MTYREKGVLWGKKIESHCFTGYIIGFLDLETLSGIFMNTSVPDRIKKKFYLFCSSFSLSIYYFYPTQRNKFCLATHKILSSSKQYNNAFRFRLDFLFVFFFPPSLSFFPFLVSFFCNSLFFFFSFL